MRERETVCVCVCERERERVKESEPFGAGLYIILDNTVVASQLCLIRSVSPRWGDGALSRSKVDGRAILKVAPFLKLTNTDPFAAWFRCTTNPACQLTNNGILRIVCEPTSVRQASGFRAVPIGTALNLRTTALHKCAVVPRRARIQGAQTCVSLNSRLESNKEEETTRT